MKNVNDTKTVGYESVRQFFRKKENIINLLTIPLIIYTVYFLYQIFYFTFTNYSIPHEYREAANIQLTQVFINGVNPYSLKSLLGEKPGTVYVYGALYSLVTAGIWKITHINIIFLHYLVSLISMIISAVLAAVIIRDHTKTVTAPLTGFLLILFCHWRYGYVNAVPDSFALLLLILIFYLELHVKIKYREIISAVITIALFFTKQYFVIICAVMIVYLFITDKKRCRNYTIASLITAAAAVIAVSITCPLYWTYSVYLAHGPWSQTILQYIAAYGDKVCSVCDTSVKAAEMASVMAVSAQATGDQTGFAYEFIQLRSLVGTFIGVFAAAALAAVLIIKNGLKNISDFTKFLIIQMIISSAALVYLGRNDGAWLSYYLQLLMPAMIIFAVSETEKMALENSRYMAADIAVAVIVLLFALTIWKTDTRFTRNYLTDDEKAAWTEAYETLNEYKDGDIYYYPLLAYNAIDNGKYFYNNGHSMVIQGWFNGEWEQFKWEQVIFPYAGKVMQANINYQDRIKKRVTDGEYSMITYIQGVDDDFGRMNLSDISQKYELKKTITLRVGRLTYDVQFWTLKQYKAADA